jgi:hypothetical protein
VQGREQAITFYLDTEDEIINAFDFKLSFPAEYFDVEDAMMGNSISSLFLQRPTLSSGVVSFAGVIPGGFYGSRGALMTAHILPKTAGEASVHVDHSQVLMHDGKGTEIKLRNDMVAVAIDPDLVGAPPPITIAPTSTDTNPPEPFIPEITHDPAVADDSYFVVFQAIDTNTGIDHYEVAEVPLGTDPNTISDWRAAESPFVLVDQSLNNDVYVKAVDKAGNFAIGKARLPVEPAPAGPGFLASWGWLLAIGAVFVLVLLLLLLVFRRKDSDDRQDNYRSGLGVS